MIAATPNEKWIYVLERDRDKPEDQQTTFKLKALDYEDVFERRNLLTSGGLGSFDMATLIAGLMDWQNMRCENGKLIPFILSDERCAVENLEYLVRDYTIVSELVKAINAGNTVTEDERKNSSSEGD